MYLSIRLGRTRIRSTHTRFPGHDLFLSTERRKHEETGGGVMEKKEEQQELEDERREAAIASTPSLQPNFKPKRGITQAQLSKLQELHMRRLQIKSKSKIKKKSRGTAVGSDRSHSKDLNVHDSLVEDSTIVIEESSISNSESHINKNSSSVRQSNVAAPFASKKHQKLHWGLDTKERWERKANM